MGEIMNSIRKLAKFLIDIFLLNLSLIISIFLKYDQIQITDRNIDFLKGIVNKIYSVFKKTEEMLAEKYENYTKFLPEKVTFVTSQELENLYPEIPAGERENRFAKRRQKPIRTNRIK